MTKTNQKLQHNISVSHQMISTQIRIIEILWKCKKLCDTDIVEHIEVLKTAVEISKECLSEHYKETEIV